MVWLIYQVIKRLKFHEELMPESILPFLDNEGSNKLMSVRQLKENKRTRDERSWVFIQYNIVKD